jgi:hypothetical protein
MLSVVMLNVVSQSKKWTGKPARVSDEEKSSITLTPGVNVIKKFPLSLTTRPNKLECLYLVITFQCSLKFAGNTRSLPKKEASEMHSNWVGSGLALKF